mgnify:CR=1 FL=1
MNKFLKLVFVSLLSVGSICGVVFGIKYIQQQKQIDNLYTEEEVEQKYQQYIDQISEKNVVIDELNGQLTILITENEQHETTIFNLQSSISEKDSQIETLTSEKRILTSQIETLNSQITELNSQIETLSEDKENNLAQIEELQSEKSALETQVSTLTASVNEKEQTIQTLAADKIELEEEISALTATISENETTISGLNSQILTLQNEITRLEGLLEGYEDIKNGTFELDFYVDETLFATKVVSKNNTLEEFDNPTKEFHKFIGWSINKIDVVDIFNMSITEDMTLYAIFEETYEWVDISYSESMGEKFLGFDKTYFTDCNDIIQSAAKIEIKGSLGPVDEPIEFIFDGSYLRLDGSTYYISLQDDGIYVGSNPSNAWAYLCFTSAKCYVPKVEV